VYSNREISVLLENLFNSATLSDRTGMMKLLPQEYQVYKNLMNPKWRLDCLKIDFYIECVDFSYCLYESVESVGEKSYQSKGVLMFWFNGEKWQLLNFPFRISGIPEFTGSPLDFIRAGSKSPANTGQPNIDQ